MRVTVELCAVLRDRCDATRTAKGDIELPDRALLGDAVDALGIPAGLEWIACVNGRPLPRDTPLAEGDRLYVFLPLSGG